MATELLKRLNITEQEERDGLGIVFDLIGELPVPVADMRQICGYIARLNALRKSAKGVLERWDGCGDHCRNRCAYCRLRNAVEAAEGS